MEKIVIIGNGISGITAARHIRKKSNHEILVISEETDYFYSRTALMYIYMGHMKYSNTKPYEDWFWKKNRIDLLRDTVTGVNTASKTLTLLSGRQVEYDKLIIASGSVPNKFGWPGQDLEGVQGMYHIQDIWNMEKYTKDISGAVIVGGGLIGIEMAEMLHTRNIPVTMLVREKSFWNSVLPEGESAMVNEIIRAHHIDLKLETELKEIKAGDKGRVKEVVTNKGEIIPCQFVGLTTGVRPNVAFSQNSDIEMEKGIFVNEYLETSQPDVYAIGDCAQQRLPLANRKPVEQVWYTGRIMGETVAETILGNKTRYQPGIWFNSAKFFNVEYQTYGWVWPQPADNEEHYFWRHPRKNVCTRFAFDKKNRNVLGINVLGMRLKHDVCDAWIREKKNIDQVIDNLDAANFDPEFFPDYIKMIREDFFKENAYKN